jgi:hypothetical protein
MSKKLHPLKAHSHCAEILKLWKAGYKITVMNAAEWICCFSLSQRCDELKKRGHVFFSIPNKTLGCNEYSQSLIMVKMSKAIEEKINKK